MSQCPYGYDHVVHCSRCHADELRVDVLKSRGEIAALREQLREKETSCATWEANCLECERQLAAVTKERDEAQGWVTRKSDDCRELRDRLAESRAEVELLHEHMRQLQQKHNELKWMYEGLCK